MNGTQLKNTEWAIAYCVYTGVDTRIMLNSEEGHVKSSNLDKTLNKFLIGIFLVQISICFIIAMIAAYVVSEERPKHDYLPEESTALEGVFSFFRYLMLLQTLIPISLIVSLEACKMVQSSYIHHDANMVGSRIRNGTPVLADVKKTNITEELGQISYIFSDKTGTLTQNEMSFKALCIGSDNG